MAQVLLEFENTVEDRNGKSYIAQVMGAERDNGMWIGWVEFTPAGGGQKIASGIETTQPNFACVKYWATGLTYFYLQGALVRAYHFNSRLAPAEQSPKQPAAAPRVPSAGVPRLEIISFDPHLPRHLLAGNDPQPGNIREIGESGILVYEGATPTGDGSTAYRFAVQFSSRNAGAMLANWLWSRLHGLGADVRVDGKTVEMTNDGLLRALARE